MDQFMNALPSIISAVAVMFLGSLVGWLSSKVVGFRKEHKELVEIKNQLGDLLKEHKVIMHSIMNMNRAQIIDICSQALMDGYIDATKFKCLCELHESYKALDGNSYTDEIVDHVRKLPLSFRGSDKEY